MTSMDQEPARTLGNLEGRIVEQSKAIENLQGELTEVSRRLDSGLLEVGRRIDAGLQEVRAGQRQILIANWVIGGSVIAAFIGAVTALIIWGG